MITSCSAAALLANVVTLPVNVGPLASTTLPVPVVPEICDALICPLLFPSGIPAHVPGVPAATFTHAATPFATAPEFCSISPSNHARVEGAAADLVGSCISSPTTGGENVSVVGVDM